MSGPQTPTGPDRIGVQALAAGTVPASLAVRAAILERVAQRGAGKTICPSEVARVLADDWRPLMGIVRAEAAAMAAEGLVEIMQRGRAIPPDALRGPIRLRLPQAD